MTLPPVEQLEVAVRASAVPDYARYTRTHRGPPRQTTDLGPSEWSVTLDSETLPGAGQGLRVGTYQVRHLDQLVEPGFFYDPEALTADEHATLLAFCAGYGHRLLTRSVFVDEILLHYGYDLRGTVVGFNLPFDLSRIATDHTKSRSRLRAMRGAFSFTVSDDPNRSRVQVKPVSGRAALVRFAEPAGRSPERRNQDKGGQVASFEGYFVDVSVLATALLGQTYTLARLADTVETEHRKIGFDDFNRPLTPELLTYAMQDVQVTWECYEKLSDRYRGFELTATPLHRILSEASIGKAHLRQIGLKPWRQLEPDFPPWLIAAAMESYYGGRAETRIRRTPTPGVLVDFASQYPTVYVLQGLWRYQIAQQLAWHDEEVANAQAMVDQASVEDVLDPALWGSLHRLVLVQPNRDALPTRARYTRRPRSSRRRGYSTTWNMGVSHRIGGPPQWWTIADAIASKLETGRTPRIVGSIRFDSGPPQSGLQQLNVAGDSRYRIDPYHEDVIRSLVELRRQIQRERDAEQATGEPSGRLDATQQGLKIAANAIAYGIGIELNVHEHAKPVKVTVHRPDGTNYKTRSRRVEDPGQWFHPVIATLVAGGGRLLLAAAMRLVHDAGGEYVFCDTDSLFIASTPTGGTIPCPGAPGDRITALTWSEVDGIVARFAALNPYDQEVIPGSILELEADNYHPVTGQQRQIEGFSIAAKRYALYQRRPDGTPSLVGTGEKRRRSEHGLGHLMPPLPNTNEETWFDLWWEHLLYVELRYEHPEPDWFDQAAVGKLTIGSFHELAAFATYNKTRPYHDQVRPFGFLIIAHPSTMEAALPGGPRCLVAPYETDPEAWINQDRWFDRHQPTPDGYRIRVGDPMKHIEDEIAVKSYRDYFDDYRRHPETKAADANGEPCHPWTRGLLQPRAIEATQSIRIGKEANRLAESPDLVIDDSDRAIAYREGSTCDQCGQALSGRQRRWCSDACRKRHHRNQQDHPSPVIH